MQLVFDSAATTSNTSSTRREFVQMILRLFCCRIQAASIFGSGDVLYQFHRSGRCIGLDQLDRSNT
jgi:hypothetical protein